MDKDLFHDLTESLKEASAIRRGEKNAARRSFAFSPSVQSTRAKTGLSQTEFARALQVSVKTLQNWEQRRRAPTGPAAALIKIVANAPKLAMEALHA